MNPWKTTAVMLLYLGAIVAANLLVNHYGPSAAPYVAFALIGCDFTARDVLHERWEGRERVLMLGGLILAGSLLSYGLNAGAQDVAIASAAAFLAAAVADTIAFAALASEDYTTRVDVSNIIAAAVDSVLFLWLAFGVFGAATFAQFAAKVAGGVAWRLVLVRRRGLLARHA